MSLVRIYLLLQAIGFAAFGVYSFLNPHLLVGVLGADSVSSDGLFEIRSIYGGTSLGAAALFLGGFLKENLQRPALYFLMAYMGGYALARLAALPLDGMPSAFLIFFWGVEIASALIALFLLKRTSVAFS